MARDSQAALVALNRFGFGARGGASGDLVNAASDPRGFVKAELNRPNAATLEMPGLQSTPALAQAVFAYQAEVKAARETAAKAGAPEAVPQATDAKAQRRNLSLGDAASEMSEKKSAMETPEKSGASAPMQSADAMQSMSPN